MGICDGLNYEYDQIFIFSRFSGERIGEAKRLGWETHCESNAVNMEREGCDSDEHTRAIQVEESRQI